MLKLITGLTLLFSLFANSVEAMTDSELSQVMRRELSKNITTLTAPKLMFHWVDASDLTPRGQFNSQFKATDPRFTEYVDKQGRKIFNRRHQNDADIAGPGLYMAGDPKVSRAYGAERSFGLIVGVIEPKSKILLTTEGIRISSEVLKQINVRGCMQVDSYIELLDTYDAACVKVKQILVGKDISFMDGRFYSWSRSLMPGCTRSQPSAHRTRVASGERDQDWIDTMVVYHSRLFSQIFGYTHKSSVSGQAMADSILSYLKGLQVHGFVSNMVSAEQLRDSSIQAMAPSELKSFSQKYILGCMP